MSITGVNTGQIQALSTANASTSDSADDSNSLFGTLVDTLNPLQHIPIISSLYRSYSGDDENAFSHVVGNTIYGGPISGIAAVLSEVYNAISGSDKPDATKTALADSTTKTAKAEEPKFTHKLMASTQDWLSGTDTSAKSAVTTKTTPPEQTASTADNAAAEEEKTADAATKTALKVYATTKDWLNPTVSTHSTSIAA